MIAEAENDFVFRIVLLTETGEIFVSFVIETAHWLKDAYRRSEAGSGGERLTGAAEKSPCAVQGDAIVNKRDISNAQHGIA